MGYVIMPGCTGPNGETLALAARNDGSIVVQDAGEITIHLMWFLVYDVTSGGFAMVSLNSLESGTPAVLGLAHAGGGTSALVLVPFRKGLIRGTTWDVVPGGNALAVRPTFDSSLNLNVAGSGPYAPGNTVIAWDGWGDGQPNEVWTFKEIDGDVFPWNYAFTPISAPSTFLTANPEDATGQLTIQNAEDYEVPAPAQLWSGQYVIDGIVPRGGVFVNSELTMALRTTPHGGAVFAADLGTMDAWSQWIVGAGPDAGTMVVRSAGNENLCLNVSGSGPYDPGNPVITWPSQGGAQNELWNVQFVPHAVT